jgi:hypothetical protein
LYRLKQTKGLADMYKENEFVEIPCVSVQQFTSQCKGFKIIKRCGELVLAPVRYSSIFKGLEVMEPQTMYTPLFLNHFKEVKIYPSIERYAELKGFGLVV